MISCPLLKYKEVDFACIPLQRVMTYDIDYSYPVWILPWIFVQPWPKEATSRLTAATRPFSYPVQHYTLCYSMQNDFLDLFSWIGLAIIFHIHVGVHLVHGNV